MPTPDNIIGFNRGARALFEDSWPEVPDAFFEIYIYAIATGIRFTREYPKLAVEFIKSGFYLDPPFEQDTLAAYMSEISRMSVQQLIDKRGQNWYDKPPTTEPLQPNPDFDGENDLWIPLVGDDELHYGWKRNWPGLD